RVCKSCSLLCSVLRGKMTVLDALLQSWDRAGTADRQSRNRDAAAGEDGFEVAPAALALAQDCVVVVSVADVLDPQPVLVAPEARQRWGAGVLAEHRSCRGGALPGRRVPVLGAGVGAEAGIEGDGGVPGGEDAGQPGAPRGVGANPGLVKESGLSFGAVAASPFARVLTLTPAASAASAS